MTLVLEEALTIAAQCWTDPETSNKDFDPDLSEAFAKRLIAGSKEFNDAVEFVAGERQRKLTQALIPAAREVMVDAFENHPEFHRSYIANVSTLIGNTLKVPASPKRDKAAQAILKHIFEG